MAHLFIVRTPMQIVSALEAMHHFQTANNTLVILHNRNKSNPKQIQKVIEIFNLHVIFDEIIEVPVLHQSKFFRSVELINTLKKRRYEKLFLGLYDSMGKLFLANLLYSHAYLIDDGTATIVAHRNMYNRLNSRAIGLKELRALFFGLHIHSESSLDFFTMFQLKAQANETIITHRFEYLKEFFSQQYHRDNTLYLLGQNITDVPILSKESYLCYIQQIVERYAEREIIYIPHRSETLHHELYELQNRHFTIAESTMPIELYFLINRIYPTHIVSFFTSALYTLNILFDKSRLESFMIPHEDIQSRHDNVRECQRFLEATSVVQTPLQSYAQYNML